MSLIDGIGSAPVNGGGASKRKKESVQVKGISFTKRNKNKCKVYYLIHMDTNQ